MWNVRVSKIHQWDDPWLVLRFWRDKAPTVEWGFQTQGEALEAVKSILEATPGRYYSVVKVQDRVTTVTSVQAERVRA